MRSATIGRHRRDHHHRRPARPRASGWKRLPDAARSLGRSMRIFKSEVTEMKKDGKSAASSDTVRGEAVPATRPAPARRVRRETPSATGRPLRARATPSARTTARAPTTPPGPSADHTHPLALAATDHGAFRRARNPEGRMSLGDHLRELRRRLVISALALLAGAVLGWYPLRPGLRPPHPAAAGHRAAARRREDHRAQLRGADRGVLPAGQHRRSSSGVIVSSPVWLYQLWAFIVPGLTRKERRISPRVHRRDRPAVPRRLLRSPTTPCRRPCRSSTASRRRARRTSSRSALYFSFVTRFILVFGLAFLLPVFLVALNVARHPARRRRCSRPGGRRCFVIFVFAAVATPTPDPFTMFLLAIPLTILYFAAHRRQPSSSTGAGARTGPSGATWPTTRRRRL